MLAVMHVISKLVSHLHLAYIVCTGTSNLAVIHISSYTYSLVGTSCNVSYLIFLYFSLLYPLRFLYTIH